MRTEVQLRELELSLFILDYLVVRVVLVLLQRELLLQRFHLRHAPTAVA